MNLYLPIAEITINFYLIFGIGLLIGLLSGIFGIGGGFISSPVLILAGIPPSIAVGTTTVQVFASSITGFWSHFLNKNIDYQIAIVLVIGGLIGSLNGVFLLSQIQLLGTADQLLKMIYIIILVITGLFILFENIKKQKNQKKLHTHSWFNNLPFKFRFRKSKLYISILNPIIIGFLIGLLTGLTGIGGGFILIPCMIYILGMTSYSVIGTSLFNISVIAFFSVIFQTILNNNIDFVLALLMIISSSIGAGISTKILNKMSFENFKSAFGILIISVSCFMIYELLKTPSNLFEVNFI